MGRKKITQLPLYVVGQAIRQGDMIAIVDSNDPTDSPEGTTKKMDLGTYELFRLGYFYFIQHQMWSDGYIMMSLDDDNTIVKIHQQKVEFPDLSIVSIDNGALRTAVTKEWVQAQSGADQYSALRMVAVGIDPQTLGSSPEKLEWFNIQEWIKGSKVSSDIPNKRLIVAEDGYYRISFNMSVDFAANDTFKMFMYKNGAPIGTGAGITVQGLGANKPELIVFTTVTPMNAGDYLEIWGQEDGGSLDLDVISAFHTLEYVSPL